MNNTGDLMQMLRWSELAEIEDFLGVPMDQWEAAPSKAKLAMGIQYILAKRTKPELTLEDCQQMTIQELTDLAGVEVVDPKDKVES